MNQITLKIIIAQKFCGDTVPKLVMFFSPWFGMVKTVEHFEASPGRHIGS